MERELKLKMVYRHFNGMLYYVTDVAINSETMEKMVVYKQLYPPYETYVRPLEMFLSPVDKVKYPSVKQEFRFEIVE